MIDMTESSTQQGGSLIKFAKIVVCSSALLASPIAVNASSASRIKEDVKVVVATKNEIKTIQSADSKIIDIINNAFNRKANVDIRYDEDLDLYFFAIKTTSNLFLSDYEALNVIDDLLSNYKYLGKSVVATLEE